METSTQVLYYSKSVPVINTPAWEIYLVETSPKMMSRNLFAQRLLRMIGRYVKKRNNIGKTQIFNNNLPP